MFGTMLLHMHACTHTKYTGQHTITIYSNVWKLDSNCDNSNNIIMTVLIGLYIFQD